MSGCSVLGLVLGCMIFGFFLGSMVIYLCMSHSISVSKSCGGGCRKFVRYGRLLWEYWFHSHWSLSVVIEAMWFPLWLYM